MSAASFDTNIVIDALNGNFDAQRELERVEDRWISRVTWIEVLSKVQENAIATTRTMLASFYMDELTLEVAERAAELRNERPKLKLADAVILASAQLNGRVLVTRNAKDFPPAMLGIRVPYSITT